MLTRLHLWLLFALVACLSSRAAEPAWPLFALCMDTHDARKRSLAEQAQMLRELGYAGAGHLWLDQVPERLSTLDASGLKLYQIYMRLDISRDAAPPYDARLKETLPLLRGRNTMLALLVTGGKPSDPAGDARAVELVREIAALAEPHGIAIALYPHVNDWLERVEDALRVATQADRPNVGVMFNLCHWLKVDEEKNLEPLLEAVGPRLFAVSINGSDGSAEVKSGTGRWIEPLDTGSYDLAGLLGTLRKVGYQGPVGLQCYGIPGDAREHLARSMAAWRALVPTTPDFSPAVDEQQEPRAMRSAMKDRPHLRVGVRDADIVGSDNRALQAAVDYVAGLGGGVVEIDAGEYTMRDSLHLRPFVTVRGARGKTVLRKAKAEVSPLALDGDYGEEQIAVVNPDGFQIGDGVAIWDSHSGGFHTTVARIMGRNGNTLSISKPLNADCMIANRAQAATVFPVISGYDLEGARVEDLVIEGNRGANVALNGCRGAGIFLYRGFGTVIERCVVRDYHGDGLSFQQSNDVVVEDCVIEGNAALGLHPGSGSQRPVVRRCIARHNGEDGLFLCWRVRHGVFENNLIENNGRFGISIGHKDSDNLLRENQVRANRQDGVFFREETLGMAAHRNRLERNVIENNGQDNEVAGIRVRGQTRDLLFRQNTIRDTRPPEAQKQTVGIRIEAGAGPVMLEDNQIEAGIKVQDRR